MSPVGDEQIFETVVVIVTDTHSAGPARFEQPRFLGDVCECTVAVVLIKPIARTFGSARQTNSREDENVEPTIVVVVQKCTAAARHFDDVVLAVNAAVDRDVTQTSSCSDILEPRVKRQSGKFSSRLDACLACGHSLAKTRRGRCAQQSTQEESPRSIHARRFRNVGLETTHCVKTGSRLQYKKYLPIDNLSLCSSISSRARVLREAQSGVKEHSKGNRT